MTAELEKAFDDIKVTLVPEGKGIFDVRVDGALIFSKYSAKRFPEPGETTALLKASGPIPLRKAPGPD